MAPPYIEFSQKDIEKIKEMYWDRDMPLHEVGEEFSVCLHTIKRVMKENGIKWRTKSESRKLSVETQIKNSIRSKLIPEELRRLYLDEGLSLRIIAKKFGCGRGLITKVLKKNKVPIRSIKEAELLAIESGGRNTAKGSRSGNWCGGRTTGKNGYVRVKIYSDNSFYKMANSQGYVMEHRLVMAQHLGRCLESWELVHHRPPGIKDDNRIENLRLASSVKEHSNMDHEEILRLQKRVTLLEAENVILREQVRALGENVATWQ